MKRFYSCPACHAPLNPNIKIILTAQVKGRRGLILFSPQPGNYQAIVSANLKLAAGNRVDFFCPICGVDLSSRVNSDLAEISFHTDSGTEGTVNFSKRYGEQATFFVTREAVTAYGDAVSRYGNVNFFGESLLKDDD